MCFLSKEFILAISNALSPCSRSVAWGWAGMIIFISRWSYDQNFEDTELSWCTILGVFSLVLSMAALASLFIKVMNMQHKAKRKNRETVQETRSGHQLEERRTGQQARARENPVCLNTNHQNDPTSETISGGDRAGRPPTSTLMPSSRRHPDTSSTDSDKEQETQCKELSSAKTTSMFVASSMQASTTGWTNHWIYEIYIILRHGVSF